MWSELLPLPAVSWMVSCKWMVDTKMCRKIATGPHSCGKLAKIYGLSLWRVCDITRWLDGSSLLNQLRAQQLHRCPALHRTPTANWQLKNYDIPYKISLHLICIGHLKGHEIYCIMAANMPSLLYMISSAFILSCTISKSLTIQGLLKFWGKEMKLSVSPS